MTFSFRAYPRFGNHARIDSDEIQIELFRDGDVSVVIETESEETPMRAASNFVLEGNGYPTLADALSNGEKWRDWLTASFAANQIGVDFRERTPIGGISKKMRGLMAEQFPEYQHLEFRPGVMAFRTEPAAMFPRIEANLVGNRPVALVQASIDAARQKAVVLGDRRRLAYDLFSGSFFEPGADGRFLMLCMALETLIEQDDRPTASQDYITELVSKLAKREDIPQAERDSLTASIEELRRESVGKAGRRLVKRLGRRKYAEMKPIEFFTEAYKLRSELVHGGFPRQPRSIVDHMAAEMERFVGDLIAIDVVDTTRAN